MENQNQHYGTNESMYVEDPNEQKEFLHSEEEKPVVTGDPSETAEDHDLNQNTQAAGMADMDDLLEEADDSKEEPDPDDDDEDGDEDPDSDDPGLDDDDEDFGLDDDDIDPDADDPDDLDLDDDDVIDDDLNTSDKGPGLDEDEDNVTYLK